MSINYIKSGYASTMFTLIIPLFSLFIYSGNLVRHFVFFFLFLSFEK